MSQRDKDVTFFTVWLLNCVADAWGWSAARVYRTLQEANIVDEYIVPLYDVLHTMGREALVEDIEIIAQNRGVSL